MPSVKDNDLLLAVRMREFCRPPTAWNRSLWSVSTQSLLREVVEAAKVRQDGILSDGSVSNLQGTACILVGRDPGVGDGATRKHLQVSLNPKTIITPASLANANIEMAVQDLEANYLPRWADAVQTGLKDDAIEHCSRCVISHLMNRGHDAAVIAETIRTAVLVTGSTVATAADLIRELHSLGSKPPATFRAVFPVRRAPLSGKTKCKSWMQGHEVAAWLKANPATPPDPGERFAGAVTMELDARDHLAAVDSAAARFAMICDRAILGSRVPIESFGYFWLSGRQERFPIAPANRGVEVASISRQDRIYDVAPEHANVDRAIALLAELDHGPASAAVTSGWAALESLAMGPAEGEERVETAIRIASLVTASFPRAELTTLAYSYGASHNDALAAELRNATSNRERTMRILDLLRAGSVPRFGRVEDTAAAMRMLQLIKDPIATMRRINQHLECALRRLYRLRNLVAHGGRTDSIVLEAGVRAAAPLVGAAFDRIHHASLSQNLNPIELIARAQLRMSLIDPTQPAQLVSLLE